MITFKSKSPYFEKERDGLKCNTVREIGDNDLRFEDCMEMIQTGKFTTINIINPETKEAFMRQITDVTYYDERFIISWKGAENDIGERIKLPFQMTNHEIGCTLESYVEILEYRKYNEVAKLLLEVASRLK